MILLVPSSRGSTHGILIGFCTLISTANALLSYEECNAFGRYTNCACYGCHGEVHGIVEVANLRDIQYIVVIVIQIMSQQLTFLKLLSIIVIITLQDSKVALKTRSWMVFFTFVRTNNIRMDVEALK